jgi:glycine cleavage system H protein
VFPDDCRYTAEHEWVRPAEREGVVRIGITDYAQEALGDIVYVSLPAVGTALSAGQSFGEVESTKSVSDIYAPLDGTVVQRNDRLDSQPELVNTDPYGDGWIVEVELADGSAVEGLLDATAYQAIVGSS